MLKIYEGYIGNGDPLKINTFKFSGGEIQLSCDELIQLETKYRYEVVARLNSSDDIMELLLLDEIFRRRKFDESFLIIPYLPYGRQDRVMKKNESFSLKVMANLLNGLCFSRISTFDCHSSVTTALIEKLKEKDQVNILQSNANVHLLRIICKSVIIAPDAGAAKKAFAVASSFKRPLAIAEKIRDTSTGEIIHTNINCSYNDMSAFIVDDICDGGRTFIELAKVLRNNGFKKIYLYITHGIFSQGLEVFEGLIDHIFTTNTFREQDEHKILTTIKVI